MEGLQQALKQTKDGIVPGLDNIHSEFLKDLEIKASL